MVVLPQDNNLTVLPIFRGEKGDPGIGSVDNTTIKLAETDISANRVVFINAFDKFEYASYSNSSHFSKTFFYTTTAGSIGTEVTAISLGKVSSQPLSNLNPLYLGDNGYLTQNPSNTGSFIIQIATVINSTTIYFNPSSGFRV